MAATVRTGAFRDGVTVVGDRTMEPGARLEVELSDVEGPLTMRVAQATAHVLPSRPRIFARVGRGRFGVSFGAAGRLTRRARCSGVTPRSR
jgi:hypothetical protein